MYKLDIDTLLNMYEKKVKMANMENHIDYERHKLLDHNRNEGEVDYYTLDEYREEIKRRIPDFAYQPI